MIRVQAIVVLGDFIFKKITISFTKNFRGALRWDIPFEPDAVSTAEGKSRSKSIAVFSSRYGLSPIVFQIFTAMEITINQQQHQLEDTCTVAQMLAILIAGEAKGIAVAINQTIVRKTDWADHLLKNGDQVMLIKATQGG